MTRRVLLFGLATALLLAGGWVAVDRLSAAGSPDVPPLAPVKKVTTAPAARDGSAGLPAASDAPHVKVSRIIGKVERRAAQAPWKTARAGDRLGDLELIRTGPGGSAKLSVGSRSSLTVGRSSEVSVREVTRAAHRFRLRQGRLSVDYKEDGERVLLLESKDGKAVARATEARFAILQTDKVVVATRTGRVDLTAAGSTVAVPAGKQAIVEPGTAPTAPAAIPKEVLLRVARARLPGEERSAVIRGQTDPGNRVLVAGKAARVDARGRFSVRVPLGPGKNQVEILTEDAAGRKKQVRRYFAVTAGAPVEGVKVDWSKRHKLDVTWDKRPNVKER